MKYFDERIEYIIKTQFLKLHYPFKFLEYNKFRKIKELSLLIISLEKLKEN